MNFNVGTSSPSSKRPSRLSLKKRSKTTLKDRAPWDLLGALSQITVCSDPESSAPNTQEDCKPASTPSVIDLCSPVQSGVYVPGFKDEDILLELDTPSDNITAVQEGTHARVPTPLDREPSGKARYIFSTLHDVRGLCSFWAEGALFTLHSVEEPARPHVFDSNLHHSKLSLTPTPETLERIAYNNILNGPITPPNPDEHNQCAFQQLKKSHSVHNCFLVHPWMLSEAALKARAKTEYHCEEGEQLDKQSFKWRKALHRKEQGKELDRVEAAKQELREYEDRVLARLEEKERRLDAREARLEEDERKFVDKWFGDYKYSRKFPGEMYLRFRPGPKPGFHVGIQTNLDVPSTAPEDNPDKYIYPST